MFFKYGLTIEKRTSPFCVYRVALLGAFDVLMSLGDMILHDLLSIESISIYLKDSPDGFVLFYG